MILESSALPSSVLFKRCLLKKIVPRPGSGKPEEEKNETMRTSVDDKTLMQYCVICDPYYPFNCNYVCVRSLSRNCRACK